jgi:hypothetical protein
MTRLEAIDALLTKVKAGEWCGLAAIKIWPQGRIVNNEWLDEFSLAQRSYNGSLDAALALIKAVLPGWGWSVGSVVQRFCAEVYFGTLDDAAEVHSAIADTPARALLIATLEALKAKVETDV